MTQIEELDQVDNVDSAYSADQAKVESQLPTNKPSNKEQKAIDLNSSGVLAPRDSTEEWRVADLMLRSGALPQQFQNVPQVIMAMQFLKQHNLPTMVAMRQTTIINGSLSIWGDLPKALVDRSGLMEQFAEDLFDADYNLIRFENKNLNVPAWGAICVVRRKGFAESRGTFTMDEARNAGLIDKRNSVWKAYPSRMLALRARSLALKNAFPDVLSGIAINEYDHDAIDAPMTAARPLVSLADEINEAVDAG